MKIGDLLRYKGYSARPQYSAEDGIFYGKILGISDLVDFQSENAKMLEIEFRKAVDDYLEFCKEIGKEPQREYNGLFNVRIPPELHKEISLLAQAEGLTLNKAVEQAIRQMVHHE
ncbi:type II toxin-antitoxin system HicB family antitoxin [Butyricicoccus sp. 1XD8-22]|nr:type II toxin-antitoxin system HicB family antitoxin [Butyricicoccus sp. 1XD8-22]